MVFEVSGFLLEQSFLDIFGLSHILNWTRILDNSAGIFYVTVETKLLTVLNA